MMNTSEYLVDPLLRARLLDLSFSLYESMHDLLDDLVFIDSSDETDDVLVECFARVNTAAMNCLGDIELLTPILHSIRKGLGAPV